MPQIQPGQVAPGQQGVPKLYGIDKTENTIPLQEKLSRLFKPQQFVTIKNIDDEPLYWQYMPQENEQVSASEDGLQQIINRDKPEMWYIGPGEVDVVPGASAYLALDVLYKNVSAKNTLRRFKDPTSSVFDDKGQHLPKNFNFADSGAQDAFIEQAYLGLATPNFALEPATPQVPTSETAPAVKPMQAVEDPNLPKPKTTEGAPVAPVSYADPEDLDDKTVVAAKELIGVKSN